MNPLHAELKELTSQALWLLLKEQKSQDRLYCEKESYQFYREFALKKKQSQTSSVSIQTNAPAKVTQSPVSPIVQPIDKPSNRSTVSKLIKTSDVLPQTQKPIEKQNVVTGTTEVKKAETVAKEEKVIAKEEKVLEKSPLEKKMEEPRKNGLGGFKLEPLPSSSTSTDADAIKHALAKIAPQIKLYDSPPSDSEAQRAAGRKKEKELHVVILFDSRMAEEEKEILKGISKALEDRSLRTALVSIQKVQQEQKWNALFSAPVLKCVLFSPSLFDLAPDLKKIWNAYSQKRGKLAHVPAFKLSPGMHLPSQIALKKELWHDLRQLLNL